MGTGFFFQQNIQNIQFYNKYFLMTNNHVLNDNFFINNVLNEKQREYIKKLILANQKFERVIFLKTSSVMSLNVEPKQQDWHSLRKMPNLTGLAPCFFLMMTMKPLKALSMRKIMRTLHWRTFPKKFYLNLNQNLNRNLGLCDMRAQRAWIRGQRFKTADLQMFSNLSLRYSMIPSMRSSYKIFF